MILQRWIRTVPPEKSIQYRLDDRPSSNSHFGVGRTIGNKFQGKSSRLKKKAATIQDEASSLVQIHFSESLASNNLMALPSDLSSLQLVRRGDKGTWGKRNSKQLKWSACSIIITFTFKTSFFRRKRKIVPACASLNQLARTIPGNSLISSGRRLAVPDRPPPPASGGAPGSRWSNLDGDKRPKLVQQKMSRNRECYGA